MYIVAKCFGILQSSLPCVSVAHIYCACCCQCSSPFVIIVYCIHDGYCVNHIVSESNNLFNILNWHGLSFIQTSIMMQKNLAVNCSLAFRKCINDCWEPWLTPVTEASCRYAGLHGIKAMQHQASIQFVWKSRILPFYVAFVTPPLESLKVRQNYHL